MRKALTLIILLLTLATTAFAATALAQDDKQDDLNRQFFQLQSDKPVFSTVREGLSSPQCRTILQDTKGYIWIGTTNGITRYDGYETHNFGNANNESKSFDRSIMFLTEDTISNCIWASLDKTQTLLRIDLNTFETTSLSYDISDFDDKKSIQSARIVYGMMAITDSTLLCRSRLCYFTINKNNGHTRLISRNDKGKNNTPRTKYLPFGGKILNVCDGTLHSIGQLDKSGIPQIEAINVPDSLGRNMTIKDAAVASDSTLAIVTFATTTCSNLFNIYELNINTKKAKYLACCNTPHGIATADDGIWIASSRGLFFFRNSDGKTYNFTTGNSTIHDNDLTCIIRVKDQPIFFIGSNDGLIKLDYYASIFEHIDMRRYSPSKDAQAWAVAKDTKGNHWVGCVDGLFFRPSNQVYFKRVDNQVFQEKGNYWVLGIEETKESDLIIVAYARRIVAYDHNGNFVRLLADRKNPPGTANEDYNVIRSVQTLPGGRFYFATDNEITIADTHTGKPLHVIKSSQKSKFRYAHTDDYKTIWIACRDYSLRRLDLNTLKITTEDDNLKTTLGRETISTIRHSKKNGVDELWMVTVRGSLLYKNPGIKGMRHIDVGIPSGQSIRSIEIDGQGNLWGGTIDGLFQINDSKTIYFPSGKFDICHQFLSRSSNIGPDGQILMGGKFDFIEFTPQKFYHNKHYPAPTISSYILANSVRKDYDIIIGHDNLYPGGPIVIPAGTRSILLKTRTLNYTGEINAAEWRLDDSDTWNRTDNTGTVALTHLSEGKHTLFLRPIDVNNKPVKNVVSTFIIHKDVFFYETRAFVVIVITSVLAAIAFFIVHQYRQNQKIQKKLATDLSTMSGMLIMANNELRNNQAIIQKQNEDLANANAILEHTVAERTRELEEAKEKAEESSQLKSTFLASLGHEVRTPMNAIVGFAKLLQNDDISQDERSEFAHLILESSNSMLSLMGALLDTSRIERGVMEVSFSDIDVYREISDTWRMLSVEKKYEGVEFRLDIDENLKDQILTTDKDRLRQIIINLTYNAFKFTNKGSVVISAQKISAPDLYLLDILPPDTKLPAQYMLLVSVADTGIGIPDDKTEAIFEPFRRLNANKLKYGGLGLGLNIVKSLTQMLGGKVWVRSQLAVGSTFYFYLPFGLKIDK